MHNSFTRYEGVFAERRPVRVHAQEKRMRKKREIVLRGLAHTKQRGRRDWNRLLIRIVGLQLKYRRSPFEAK
jgi:hypothetical protein